jgi:TonB family protein
MPSPRCTPRSALVTAAAMLLLLTWGAMVPATAAANEMERDEEAANLLGDANEHFEQRRYGLAAETARRVMALADGDHLERNAAVVLGLALHNQWSLGLDDASEERLKRLFGAPGGPRAPSTPDDELLTDAVAAFRRAVDLDPEGRTSARFNLALALYYLQRDSEALVVTADYVQRGGTDPEVLALHGCLDVDQKGELREVGGEVRRPEKISGENPAYHDLARAFGVEGTVVLEAVIDKAGEVRCLRPLKRLPLGLTEAAMQTVRGWRFKPATVDGEPVTVYYTLTVNFMIDRTPGPG